MAVERLAVDGTLHIEPKRHAGLAVLVVGGDAHLQSIIVIRWVVGHVEQTAFKVADSHHRI